jgi:hypothetical protein
MAEFITKAETTAAPRQLGTEDSHDDHEAAHAAAHSETAEFAATRAEDTVSKSAVVTDSPEPIRPMDKLRSAGKKMAGMASTLSEWIGAHPPGMGLVGDGMTHGLMDHPYGTMGKSKEEREAAAKVAKEKAKSTLFDAGEQVR